MEKLKWKDTVVSPEPLWGAKINSSLSAQVMHNFCLANVDTREEGRTLTRTITKN